VTKAKAPETGRFLLFDLAPGLCTWYYDLTRPVKGTDGSMDYAMVQVRGRTKVPTNQVKDPDHYVTTLGVATYTDEPDQAPAAAPAQGGNQSAPTP